VLPERQPLRLRMGAIEAAVLVVLWDAGVVDEAYRGSS
jgi:hypothetical protein